MQTTYKTMKIKRGKKGMIAINELLKWIIGIVILVIAIIAISILAGKGDSAIEYIKQIFRFGR